MRKSLEKVGAAKGKDARAATSSAPPPRAPARRTSSARSPTCTSCTRCSTAARRTSTAPSLVFQEADLPIRVLRDVLGSEFDGAEIDDQKQYERVTSFFQRTAPELVDLVEMHSHSEHLFERYGAEEAFRSTLSRRVDLPSGGYLIIDYAEALTVIDINTG